MKHLFAFFGTALLILSLLFGVCSCTGDKADGNTDDGKVDDGGESDGGDTTPTYGDNVVDFDEIA